MSIRRKKKKKSPKQFHISTLRKDGYAEKVALSAAEHPSTLFLYQFGPPDFISGLPPVELIREAKPWSYIAHPKKDLENLFAKFGTSRIFLGEFNAGLFCRMLAKIAHAFAVADLGNGRFKPYLADLISGRTNTPSYWVGGSKELPARTQFLHQLSVEYIRKLDDVADRLYLVVHIRLFANLGAPQYCVVVGERDFTEGAAQ
jgi:hypothetical protein